MQSARILIPAVLLGILSGCAPSLLWTGDTHRGTGGEVPRDEYGEPLWSAIVARPRPPQSQPAPAEVAPVAETPVQGTSRNPWR